MTKYTDPLSHVKVASPCSAGWENMLGDARRRFCGQCQLNVYNLSAMTRRDAEELINQSEGRLCVRFFRRADGTILTQDCPVGLRAMRRRLKRVRTAVVSSVLSFLTGVGLHTTAQEIKQQTGQPEFMEKPVVMGTMVAPKLPPEKFVAPPAVYEEVGDMTLEMPAPPKKKSKSVKSVLGKSFRRITGVVTKPFRSRSARRPS